MVERILLDYFNAFALLGILFLTVLFAWVFWNGVRKTPLNPISFDGLPLKNPNLSNTEQGLYNKFQVQRRDGSDIPGGKHDCCDYFVLDLTHDPYALETVAYYAQACKETHPLLYRDLMGRVNAAFIKMDDEGKL
jgi:hypothetical protein